MFLCVHCYTRRQVHNTQHNKHTHPSGYPESPHVILHFTLLLDRGSELWGNQRWVECEKIKIYSRGSAFAREYHCMQE